MFTGIVEEIGRIETFAGRRVRIAAREVLTDAHLGDSIAVSGCCLTVVELGEDATPIEKLVAMLPAPGAVFGAIAQQFADGQALSIVWTSVSRGILGFLLAVSLALTAGISAVGGAVGGAIPEAVLHAIIFVVSFVILDWISPYHLWDEIVRDKNLALAVLIGAMSIGICIIIASAVH